jgi:ribonuclease BN (tRNA processing enzyme)
MSLSLRRVEFARQHRLRSDLKRPAPLSKIEWMVSGQQHLPAARRRLQPFVPEDDPMHIQILGTGGYHPNERRHTACVFIPELGLVFDAGTGFFRVASRLRTDRLHICLSHAHLDHIVGLTYVLVPMMQGRLTEVTVYGTRQTLEAVREHLFAERVFPIEPALKYVELQDGVSLGDDAVSLTYQRLPSHPGGSTAFRLDLADRPGRPAQSIAYVTDTTVDGSYTEFVRGVDLLIHECNFSDALAEWCDKTGHSHTSQVAQLAAEAQVGRLLLLHIDPLLIGDDPIDLAVARAIFPETELAEDLMNVVL